MKAGPALSVTAPVMPVSEAAGLKNNKSSPPLKEEAWVLYVTGGVAAPGVYHLPPGSRVYQLVDASGGLLPKADPVRINLAAPLADGMHVHIPLAGESQEQVFSQPLPAPSSGASLLRQSSSPRILSAGETSSLVNVNTASSAELQRLPGVGPAIAQAIVDYRNQRGNFTSLQDLLKVKGIGPKKLEALRDAVTLR